MKAKIGIGLASIVTLLIGCSTNDDTYETISNNKIALGKTIFLTLIYQIL